jgi:hypothetical protein
MGNFMDTIMKNGLYGKYETAEPGFIHLPKEMRPYAEVDTRYNVPKQKPKASSELVEKTIKSTEIYRRARLAIMQPKEMHPETRMNMLQAQRKQVAYGIDKYPEPLNADTWSTVETIDHIIDESIDKLHYLIMLNIKHEQELLNTSDENHVKVHQLSYRIEKTTHMIYNAIDEMDDLLTLRLVLEDNEIRESEACNLSMMHPMNIDELKHFSPDELDELLKKGE